MILPVSDLIDRYMAIIKWPVAIVVAAMLPGASMAFLHLLSQIAVRPQSLLPFVMGGLIWLGVWLLFVRHSRLSFLLTFEHELTHAIFAWLTFHRVVGLRVTLTKGGQISIVGRGNWLITIAPYFWPTASLLVILATWFWPPGYRGIGQAILGFSFTWHVTGTIYETRFSQPDIRQVGWLFSVLLLSTANVVALASILSFAHQGMNGLSDFFAQMARHTLELYRF